MSPVLVHHPVTGADLVVDDGALVHMRVSGWMLRTEWEVHQAAVDAALAAQEKAAAEAVAAQASSKAAAPAAKTGKEN